MAISVAQIDAAISTIMTGGQSYTIGDTTFTRADLDALNRMRKAAVEVERASGGKMFQRVRFGKVGT